MKLELFDDDGNYIPKPSKWIPTSERHPNHAGEYLVTMIGVNGKREVGIVKFRLDGRNKQPFF